jgi:hypothetical protein
MIAFGLPVGFGLALLLIWLVFRKGGYKRRPLDAPPGPDWSFTGERFLDPPSGEMVEVWSRPKTGERAYVRARPDKASYSGGARVRGNFVPPKSTERPEPKPR